MEQSDIPEDVLVAIRNAAEEYWDDDIDMMQATIDTEVGAYIALNEIEFGAATTVRQIILNAATESEESWEERLSIVESQITAYQQLHELCFENAPDELILKLKAEASQEYEGDFSTQLEHVEKGIRGYHHAKEIKAKIGPVSELLIKMEQIIGSECYNSNMRNYGPGGIWESEGRSFRYPVKFLDKGEVRKHHKIPADIAPHVLLTGCYQFGSNELSIFRALSKIVDMIEQDYGVNLTDAKLKR
jgi:hypothetical protein